ncbi:E3 ubiquitin-protein ligase MBR2-like [Mangifera indica]|uniref:E3 ubiquitin-protein ligase MBR2-like n=1 Tax=Mangifera indica TaxID=29780 RepID=UPI001CFC0D27|nr:E3 ubiquitin-protein ligase MBR2-like [Mangifera indica]
MQGQGSTIDSFPEPVNIDQGSVSNNTGMNQQTSLNNVLNPVESRLSNYTVASAGASCVNAVSNDDQSCSGWNSGESSSRMSTQNQMNDDGMKMEHGWSSSYTASNGVGPRSEERRFEPPSVIFPGRRSISRSGNQVRSEPLFFQGSSSNNVPQNVNLSAAYADHSGNGGLVIGGLNHCSSGALETEQAYSAGAVSDNVGTSSGSSGFMEENSGGSGSSLGGWGLSCKRKALEGTSGQSCSAGDSSCFPQAENALWHPGPTSYDASSSLSLSPPSQRSPSVCPPEQPNPRFGFPSSGITANTENHLRNFSRRVDPGNQQDSLPFSLSSTASTGRSNVGHSQVSPVPLPFSDSLDLRLTAAFASNTIAAQNQPPAMHVSAQSRNVHSFSWNGASSSRAANLSNSIISGERGAALREEANLISIPRNNAELPMFVPSAELRTMVQDPTSWSLATGSSSGGVSSNTRNGSNSSIHALPAPAWVPQNPTMHSHQRLIEFAPWSLFPSSDSESGGRSGHFPPLSVGPSSSQEAVVTSGSNSQVYPQPLRRSSLLVERQGDDVLGMPRSLQALAADIEGRHRLISEIRQVLHAMRRGENLRIEDYMLFDPFIYQGLAEMHDRHRDMRLDVDNMSYEELLALEERIGNVSTGLSEETILKLMKQKKYMSIAIEVPLDQEPCCICQEDYMDGDDLGMLDCGHDFHNNCIKQWLMQKNLCPICKTTALPT